MTDDLLMMLVALGRKFHFARLLAGHGPGESKPGDLVVEIAGLRIDPDAIGILVGHGDAPYNEDDPPDGSVPMREVWDVRPLSGRHQGGKDYQRWENANFVRLPGSVAGLWPANKTTNKTTADPTDG